jgi:hypothetical protein
MAYLPRGHARFEIPGWISLKSGPGADSSPLKCDLVNLSFKGCLVLAAERLEPGAAVDFDLVPELVAEHIHGQGIIRHARELHLRGNIVFALGIEFLSSSKEALISLFNVYHTRVNLAKREVNKPKIKYDGPF